MGKSLEEMKAEFLARGGQVKVLPSDATNGMKASDWKDALSDRGVSPANSSRTSPKLTGEQFAEQRMEAVRDAAMVGGQKAAMNALNDFNMRPKRKKSRVSKAGAEAQARYNEEWGVEY